MAVRQYIGARYVTKIYENSQDPSSAEWEAGITWEPLVIVTYQNGSYMSKKPIPGNIGAPPENPAYWTQTGFYNGQIAALNERVGNVEQAVDEVKDVVNIKDWGIVPDISIDTPGYISQGMATDDLYIYVGMYKLDGNNQLEDSRIGKYTKSGALVDTSANLIPYALNSLFVADNKIYTIGYDAIAVIDSITFDILETIPVTPDNNYCSCFIDGDKLYACNKTTLYNVTDGVTEITFNPAPFLKTQSCKKIGDNYIFVCNNPSSLLIYDNEGTLIKSLYIPNILRGITLNEAQDIEPFEGGILMNFNADGFATETSQFIKIYYNGNDVAEFNNQNTLNFDSAGSTNVYVDAAATNTFRNGSAQYPFNNLFDACNYIRNALGGCGRIMVKAGTYDARFFSIDCIVSRDGDGTVTINCDQFDTATVSFYRCDIKLPDTIVYSRLLFRNCTFQYPDGQISVVTSKISSSTSIQHQLWLDASSEYQGPTTQPKINTIAQSTNTYKVAGPKYAGDVLFELEDGSYYPKVIDLYFRATQGFFTISIPICAFSHITPVQSSVILTNGTVFTIQLTCSENKITYSDCVRRSTASINSIADRYTTSGVASNFPYVQVGEARY